MTTGVGDMVIWKGREIPAHIPGLSFGKEKHLYTFKGRPLKSVTGYTSKLQDHSFANQIDMDFGSAVHEYLYLSDTEMLGRGGDDRMIPYIEGWNKFKKHREFYYHKMLAEYPLYSPKYLYSGTFDRLFETDNFDWLIDIKTGPLNKIVGLQLSAYGKMAIENNLTTAARLKLMGVSINNLGKCTVQMYGFKENFNYFLMQYSLINYLTK